MGHDNRLVDHDNGPQYIVFFLVGPLGVVCSLINFSAILGQAAIIE